MSLVLPDRYVCSVDHIDLDALRAQGVRAVLLDRDNTLVPRDTGEPPASVAAWLDAARERGLLLCMVSNNWHGDQVRSSAAALGLAAISHAMKPAPFALLAALRRLGVSPREAVMVGDQLFTDVTAAHLAGMRAILVKPQTVEDLWYTNIFRLFERRLLARVSCEE